MKSYRPFKECNSTGQFKRVIDLDKRYYIYAKTLSELERKVTNKLIKYRLLDNKQVAVKTKLLKKKIKIKGKYKYFYGKTKEEIDNKILEFKSIPGWHEWIPSISPYEPCKNETERKERAEIRRNKWRVANPEKAKQIKSKSVEKYYKDKKEWLARYKAGLRCQACREASPECLDFHHIDPKKKEFTISKCMGKRKADILLEISKCYVLCANCHRKLHAGTLTIDDEVMAG